MRHPFALFTLAWRRAPLASNIVASGCLAGLSDTFAQVAIEKKKLSQFNTERTARFTSVCALYVAPVIHVWFGFLSRRVTGTALTKPLKMVFIDQVVWAPGFLFSIMSLIKFMEVHDARSAVASVKHDFASVYIKNLLKCFGLGYMGVLVWVPVQLGNFSIVPLRYRVLTSQCAAFVWNTYLSWRIQSIDTIVIDKAVVPQ